MVATNLPKGLPLSYPNFQPDYLNPSTAIDLPAQWTPTLRTGSRAPLDLLPNELAGTEDEMNTDQVSEKILVRIPSIVADLLVCFVRDILFSFQFCGACAFHVRLVSVLSVALLKLWTMAHSTLTSWFPLYLHFTFRHRQTPHKRPFSITRSCRSVRAFRSSPEGGL